MDALIFVISTVFRHLHARWYPSYQNDMDKDETTLKSLTMSSETCQALPAPYFKGRGKGWGCIHLKNN